MRANRHQDTGPEMRLRRVLHARGHRYRVALPLVVPGRRVRPDLVFTKRRVAVFIDGCFWHCCPQHGRAPSDPTGYWTAKLNRNVQRDEAVNAALSGAGWRVVRLWEHENLDRSVAAVEAALQESPTARG